MIAGAGLASSSSIWFEGAGIRIHGLDWGGPSDGTPLLLLHGVGGNALIWSAVAPQLRMLLPGHRIVAIDQRDGGDTDHPATGYDRAAFSGDVAAVHDAVGGRPMVLVGHSRPAGSPRGLRPRAQNGSTALCSWIRHG